jgi:hypothetical protein
MPNHRRVAPHGPEAATKQARQTKPGHVVIGTRAAGFTREATQKPKAEKRVGLHYTRFRRIAH